jgi:glycosyltransferase involved in cell wall biosynthesis
MRVGIYNEPSASSIGGTELCVVTLAEGFRNEHEVDIIHHQPGLTQQALCTTFDCELEGVHLRYVPREPDSSRDCRNPWRRYRQAQEWQAELSRPYDLFINFCHMVPPFCHARLGLLVILFPLVDRPNQWPWKDPADRRVSPAWRWLCRRYDAWEWKRRLDSYRIKTAISEFSREWTRRWWGVDCEIFHPPTDARFRPAAKASVICSVGRFAPMKNQAALVAAFRQMQGCGVEGWKYICAGGLGESTADRQYLATVRDQAGDAVELLVNAERPRIRELYEGARIFWHGAGFGADAQLNPGRMEHWGIATVEAMAAGCVPVVYNQGGQTEIVQHGVSGFLWNTLPELQEFTLRLTRDEALCERMACAARERAADFSRDNFLARCRALVQPHLSQMPSRPMRATSNVPSPALTLESPTAGSR